MTDDPGDDYPPIGSLAAIGDGRSLALLDSSGRIQWYCPLRFDNPPLVWALLDHERGGRVGLDVGSARPTMSYLPETGVVRYEWSTDTGHAQATVAMPLTAGSEHQDVLFYLDGLEGSLHVDFVFDPRPDFAHDAPQIERGSDGITMHNEPFIAAIAGNGLFHPADRGIRASAPLAAGEQLAFVVRLSQQRDAALPSSDPAEVKQVIEATVREWREWVETITYQGPYRDVVVRSAIALKQLIYEPSGAVVAAGTTSLPEEIGGVRNWDYRYTWLRDASFTVNALYQLGCTREARRYGEWMCRTTAKHGVPLRVFYGVGAETSLPEREIDFADGYRGSRPVRIGNAAEHQLQLDSYGELLDCVSICHFMGDEVIRNDWCHFRNLIDFVADHWRERDSGIWEVRDDPRHFTQSKAMAWVALDRGVRLARDLHLEADTDRWEAEAQTLRDDVLSKAIIEEHHCFGRAYGEDFPDASLLTLPLVGFVAGDDPRMLNTIELVRRALAPEDSPHDGLLYRYRPETGDGLPGHEGAFTICSFWLVQALCSAGRREDARDIFETVLSLQGDVGLFAEELDPESGDHLGNFPQAFSHIGLINAAVALQERVEDSTRTSLPNALS